MSSAGVREGGEAVEGGGERGGLVRLTILAPPFVGELGEGEKSDVDEEEAGRLDEAGRGERSAPKPILDAVEGPSSENARASREEEIDGGWIWLEKEVEEEKEGPDSERVRARAAEREGAGGDGDGTRGAGGGIGGVLGWSRMVLAESVDSTRRWRRMVLELSDRDMAMSAVALPSTADTIRAEPRMLRISSSSTTPSS